MSLKETPMTRRLWQSIGGVLFEEFVAVAPGPNRGTRRLDGLLLPGELTRLAERGEVPDLAGREVVVIQAKASRLGMNVLGQALFSKNSCEPPARDASVPSRSAPATTKCCGHWLRNTGSRSSSTTGTARAG
jgi:hypothetical protein